MRPIIHTTAALVLAATAAQAQTGGELNEVVVTGSRVIKNGNDSPTPVTVVTVEDMATVHPGNIADQLNDLPLFAGSRGQTTNPGGGSQGTSSAASNPSANVINLRNMGYPRTLILINGHRLAPTGTDGTVDTNMVPNMLLQRVDIVTGGASAIYGSDAVTGAVNFIINPKFNGLKVNGQAGISHYKDDRSMAGGVAGGMDLFGGRGHIEGSVESRHVAGVLHRSDRPFGRNRVTLQNPTNGTYGPYVLVRDTKSSQTSFGGLMRSGPYNAQEFSQNGILTPFNFGTPYGTQFHSGGSGAYDDTTLQTPLDQNQMYGRFDFDFTDSVHGYADVAGNYSHTWAQATYNNLGTPNGSTAGAIRLSTSNAFLPTQYRTALAAFGQTSQPSQTFLYAKRFTNMPATNVDTWVRQGQTTLGLDVELGGGYEWDTNYSHARGMQNTRQNANINALRLQAALDAVVDPATNRIVCAVSLTANAGLYPGCVPMNVFGPNSESPESINYVLGVTQFRAYTTLDDVNTSITGAPFSTWAGPVNMALSAEWRKLSYHLDTDTVPNDASNPISCAGLPTYGCTQNVTAQTWSTQISSPRSLVSQSVKEAAIEFGVPLIKDAFLADDVSLNAAARWTDYSTSGSIWSWKGGLVWHVGDQLTFRGTRSRDIRAPTLNDLYVPPSPGLYGGNDFLTGLLNINPSIPFIAKGNENLVPEIGNTTTAGFVYQPTWLPGFSVSVDGFMIDITDALASFRGASENVMTGCAASGGSSAFCQLIVRPINCCSTALANTATTLYTQSLNLATQWTEGIDLELNYAGRVFDRPYSLRALTTFQPHLVYKAPGSSQYNMAGVAFNNGALQATPVWRASVLARISPFENFTIDVLERWRSPLDWGPKYAPPETLQFSVPRIESVWYTNLNLSYLFKHESNSQTEVYLNVTNLFNRQPPPAVFFGNNNPGNFGGFANGDDPIGSIFTLGFRYRH